MKLRFDFERIRANVRSQTSLLSMQAVLAELLREETRVITQSSTEGSSNYPLALAAQHNKPRNLSRLQCFECKGFGHTVSHCKKKRFVVTTRNMGILSQNTVSTHRMGLLRTPSFLKEYSRLLVNLQQQHHIWRHHEISVYQWNSFFDSLNRRYY